MHAADVVPVASSDIAERARRILVANHQPTVVGVDVEVGHELVVLVARHSLDGIQAERLASGDVSDIRGLSEPFRRLIEAELKRAVELVLGRPVVASTTATPHGSHLSIDTFLLEAPRQRWMPRAAPEPGTSLPAGRRALSDREIEVLQCGADGSRLVDIAERLFISPSTVKTHFEHIYEKLAAHDRAHAVAIGMRAGWIK